VRVDVVAMPTQTLKELKSRDLAPPPENPEKALEKAQEASQETGNKEQAQDKEEEPIGKAVEFKKVGKKDFMSLLKNLSKKEVKSGTTGSKSKGKMLDREELNSLIISGNKISKGNSLTGTAGVADEGAFAQYVSAIPFRVKNFWRLPSYLLGRNLKCRIRIYINSSGELIRSNVFESSGVDEFDQRALEAVQAASPFPAPEEIFSGNDLKVGGKKKKISIDNEESFGEYIDIKYDGDIYVKSAFVLNHETSTWDSENIFLRELRYSKYVFSILKNFEIPKNAIGAHIRMEADTGNETPEYDQLKNWSQDSHNQIQFWREKSHYSSFIKKIDSLLADQPDSKIFLATDLKQNYETFEKIYGARLIYQKRNNYDRSKQQIIEALADVILLSKCDRLLGSTWSSFTELAMRFSQGFNKIEMSGVDF
jgi:TonB family protein